MQLCEKKQKVASCLEKERTKYLRLQSMEMVSLDESRLKYDNKVIMKHVINKIRNNGSSQSEYVIEYYYMLPR